MNAKTRNMKGKQGKADRGKGRRINLDNERRSKFEEDVRKLEKTDKSNDVRWYANNPELLTSAASLSFSQTTGSRIPLEDDTLWGVPGVMSISWLPTIGGVDDDAVNASKESLYSYVVHANSRNTSYTSSDLMIVVLAGASLFGAISSAIRAYGIMKLFDQRNKYLPKALVNAMGFNYEDLQSNLSNMWFDINEMIARSTQIWIPNTLPIVERWVWLNSNVYQDSASVKGQYYVFAQDCFWIYDALGSSTGGSLQWVSTNGVPLPSTSTTNDAYHNSGKQNTWAQFKTAVNGMFNALLDSEDRGIIMGDILKAFGPDKIYALSSITSEYTVSPVYDTEVLTQIENCVPWTSMYRSVIQNQTTGKLNTKWGQWTSGYTPTAEVQVLNRHILNFHQKEVPTPAQIMVATRLQVAGSQVIAQESDTTKIGIVVPRTMGSEYVDSITVYVYYDNELTTQNYATQGIGIAPTSPYAQMAFDWSPWFYNIVGTISKAGDAITSYVSPKASVAYGEYDYYTVLDRIDLQKMHTTAVYSELGVPVL